MATTKTGYKNTVRVLTKSCLGWVGIVVGGIILFGVFRYWLGPLFTAATTCWGIDNCLYSVSVGDSSVRRVRFSPDGSTLAVVGNNEYIVDAADGSRISDFASSSDTVSGLVFAQDSQYFAYKNQDQLTIHTIDGDVFSEFEFKGSCAVLRADCIAFVPYVNGIAITGGQNGFNLFYLNGEQITTFPTANKINGMQVSPDSQTIALAESSGRIYLHQITDLTSSIELIGHDGDIRQMVFSGNNQRLISVGQDDDQTRVWDVATGELLHLLPAVGNPTDMGVDGSGQFVAIAEDSGLVTLWDLETADIIQEWFFDRSVRTVSLSPDGSQLALGLDRTVTMIDDQIYTQRRPGQSIERRRGPSFNVSGESVSAGSALVLSTGLE